MTYLPATQKILSLCLITIALCSCSRGKGINLYPYKQHTLSPQNFELCHGFSCTYKTPVSISQTQWQEALNIFHPPATNAAEEKQKIVHAIAMIERTVNTITKMNPDLGKAENFESDEDQMDCIDETINTSLFLKFLEKENVIKWHKVGEPIHRGYFIDAMWPHNSATIIEKSSNQVFAVDSYWYNNGAPAQIIHMDIWMDSWDPTEDENPTP